MVTGAFEHGCRDGEERVKPAPCLVDGFADIVHGERAIKLVFVLKRIVPLGERSATRVEPAVHDVGLPYHLSRATARGAVQLYVVHVRTVQLWRHRRAIGLHRSHLFDAAYAMLVTAIWADPHGDRGAPVSLATDCPVLDVREPLSHALGASPLGGPFDLRVVLHYLIAHRSHTDEPTVHRVVQ